MAVMSVRTNSSSGPRIDLGDTFAKALFGDTDNELKLAKLRDDIATSEYQRRQIQSATDYNNARTATEGWELSSRQGMVPALGKVIEQGVNASQQPVIVQPAPAAAAAPPAASEPPAIVEPPAAAAAPAAAAPAATPPPVPPAPSIIRLPDDQQPPPPAYLNEPEMPAALQPPSEAESQFVTSPDAAYLRAQRGEGWDATSGAEGNLPIIIEPGPEASAASILNVPETPTEEPPTAAAAAQPVPATAATAPASVASAPAPTAPADANTHPAAPEPQTAADDPILPDKAPVPTAKPGAPNDASPHSADKVVVPTNTGPVVIDRQEAEALAAGLIAGGGDVSGQSGKLIGQIKVLNDPTLTPAQKAAILYTGSTPGKESVVGGPDTLNPKDRILVIDNVAYTRNYDANGQEFLTLTPGGPQKGPGGPFQSKSAETDYQQIIGNLEAKFRDPKAVITAEDAELYDRSVAALYGTKYEYRSGPDDTTIKVPIDPARPLVLVSPSAMYKRAGVNVPAAPAAGTSAAPAPDANAGTGTGAPAPAPVVLGPDGQPVPPAAPVPPGGADPDASEADYKVSYDPLHDQPIQVVYTGKKKMTELESKNTGFYIVSSRAAKELDKIGVGQSPSAIAAMLADPTRTDWRIQLGSAIFTKPETTEYWINASNFVNAVLRSESGAATRPEEFNVVMRRFIPQANDDDRTIALKKAYRGAVLEGLRRGSLGEKPTAAELVAYAEQTVGPLPERAAPADSGSGGGTSGTGTGKGRLKVNPTTGKVERV